MSEAVILYDADCGFCRWTVERLLAWDRTERLRAATLEGPEAVRLLGGMGEEAKMASWHFVIDGNIYSGGAVAAPLLRLLPGGRRLAPVVAAFPRVSDRAYRLAARKRDSLGRLAGARCAVDPGRGRGATHPGHRGEA